jgi:hypothetical protein
MEHSHADHRGVHNRILGKPEETPIWVWMLLTFPIPDHILLTGFIPLSMSYQGPGCPQRRCCF